MEQWAEIRRLHFVKGLGIREIHRRTGLRRETIRRAIASDGPPVYRRPAAGSKLDPFKDEIHRLLAQDPKLPGVRVRELLEPVGSAASKTVVDDYLREVRPLFAPPPRTFQRTAYRPGELVQFDVWQPKDEVPVGHGQTRRGWVVVACLGYSRAGSGMLVFSKETPDLLAGIAGCLQHLGGLPQCLVWDRQAGIHGHAGRPSEAFAAFCGQLKTGWVFCEPADPQAKGAVERLQGYAETNFEPGRRFANHIDFQDQLDGWFAKVNARTHKTLRARPVDRLAAELEVMARLPGAMPDTARRWVTRVPPDPHLRFDTNNDYSLDPALAGRRVEVRVDQRQVTAVALDTGELACRHDRVFAKHRTITALEHASKLRAGARDGRGPAAGPLRRLDRMSRPTTELAHLFRQLKAPAAAAALPKLADRARAEEWSFEQFAAALLKTETDNRDSHGGQSRIKTARFPARKTIEEFDFAFQASLGSIRIVVDEIVSSDVNRVQRSRIRVRAHPSS